MRIYKKVEQGSIELDVNPINVYKHHVLCEISSVKYDGNKVILTPLYKESFLKKDMWRMYFDEI